MSLEEAGRIVATREKIGRLSDVEEVIMFANLSEATAARLRETAVFL
jgi:hypothetical protein